MYFKINHIKTSNANPISYEVIHFPTWRPRIVFALHFILSSSSNHIRSEKQNKSINLSGINVVNLGTLPRRWFKCDTKPGFGQK